MSSDCNAQKEEEREQQCHKVSYTLHMLHDAAEESIEFCSAAVGLCYVYSSLSC